MSSTEAGWKHRARRSEGARRRPGRAVASRGRHSACSSSHDRDAPPAVHTQAARRAPSASAGRGGRSCCADGSCTGPGAGGGEAEDAASRPRKGRSQSCGPDGGQASGGVGTTRRPGGTDRRRKGWDSDELQRIRSRCCRWLKGSNNPSPCIQALGIQTILYGLEPKEVEHLVANGSMSGMLTRLAPLSAFAESCLCGDSDQAECKMSSMNRDEPTH